MNFLRTATDYLLGGPRVGGASEDRLRRWMALPEPDLTIPHARARYVVVDTETSGSDPRRGALVAIGAVGVASARIDLADCFGTALRRGRTPGPGVGAQGELAARAPDADPALGLLDFMEHSGRAPLVAFDAGIQRAVMERAMKTILGVPVRQRWIDVAVLLPALFPDERCATRGQWLDRFGLADGAWHDALADALVTAQLLLAALDAATRAGLINAAQLIDCRRGGR